MIQKKRRESNSGMGYYTCWEKGRPSGCIYCGKPANTREHVPSKTMLIEPFPENLPTIPALRVTMVFQQMKSILFAIWKC